jgi:hypothetical protein
MSWVTPCLVSKLLVLDLMAVTPLISELLVTVRLHFWDAAETRSKAGEPACGDGRPVK